MIVIVIMKFENNDIIRDINKNSLSYNTIDKLTVSGLESMAWNKCLVRSNLPQFLNPRKLNACWFVFDLWIILRSSSNEYRVKAVNSQNPPVISVRITRNTNNLYFYTAFSLFWVTILAKQTLFKESTEITIIRIVHCDNVISKLNVHK